MAEQLNKIKQDNKKIVRRIGYRYLYHRLENMSRFQGQGSVPRVVRKSTFHSSIEAISMENAMIT